MIINDLDDYYIVFDAKNRNTELDTLINNAILRTVNPCSSVCQKYRVENKIIIRVVEIIYPWGKLPTPSISP